VLGTIHVPLGASDRLSHVDDDRSNYI